MMPQEPKKRSGTDRLERLNQKFPVGACVEVEMDDGSKTLTRTRSKVWIVARNQAVVALEGIAGGFDVRRVRAAKGDFDGLPD